MTGTLSGENAGFPWGYASNTIPASNFYSIDGDAFTANFTFHTGNGSISSGGGVTTLSGPATIATGDVVVAGHDFLVPPCAFDPCITTTTALYSRSSNGLEVLFYEDSSASAGLVLQAQSLASWGPNLTDPISTQPVTSTGLDIILQPPNSYYNLAAFATVNTVSVTSGVPEPASWAVMLVGLAGLGGALRIARRKAREALLTA
jgi:hypothetical protein